MSPFPPLSVVSTRCGRSSSSTSPAGPTTEFRTTPPDCSPSSAGLKSPTRRPPGPSWCTAGMLTEVCVVLQAFTKTTPLMHGAVLCSVLEPDARAASSWSTSCWTWLREREWWTFTTASRLCAPEGSTWYRLRWLHYPSSICISILESLGTPEAKNSAAFGAHASGTALGWRKKIKISPINISFHHISMFKSPGKLSST